MAYRVGLRERQIEIEAKKAEVREGALFFYANVDKSALVAVIAPGKWESFEVCNPEGEKIDRILKPEEKKGSD